MLEQTKKNSDEGDGDEEEASAGVGSDRQFYYLFFSPLFPILYLFLSSSHFLLPRAKPLYALHASLCVAVCVHSGVSACQVFFFFLY